LGKEFYGNFKNGDVIKIKVDTDFESAKIQKNAKGYEVINDTLEVTVNGLSEYIIGDNFTSEIKSSIDINMLDIMAANGFENPVLYKVYTGELTDEANKSFIENWSSYTYNSLYYVYKIGDVFAMCYMDGLVKDASGNLTYNKADFVGTYNSLDETKAPISDKYNITEQ
jgi:hypothetical protein